ncbi:MAG: glycosyltransferase [Gemmatimonadaceae bacterium]|nr:glycosyltransferase [Gemmatimonadaceae bacterium]
MTLAVVTPWLDCLELTSGFWDAVDGADEVLVVDQGSTPPLTNAAIRLEENVGYNRANNLGLQAATSDAVLFCNNDVVKTGPWLDGIREAVRPGVLVGAEFNPGHHAAVDGRPVPYLSGWCLAGMRADLLASGGWDEGFEEPAYYGDNDLCARARAVGMRLVHVPCALTHLGNYTTRRVDVSAVSARNRTRYEQRVRALRTPIAA